MFNLVQQLHTSNDSKEGIYSSWEGNAKLYGYITFRDISRVFIDYMLFLKQMQFMHFLLEIFKTEYIDICHLYSTLSNLSFRPNTQVT